MVKSHEAIDVVRLSPSNWLAFIGMLGTLCITLVSGAWMMSNAVTELRTTTKHLTDSVTDLKGDVTDLRGRVERVERSSVNNKE